MNDVVTLKLAGRQRTLQEPVFKRLKAILAAYNLLADSNAAPATQEAALAVVVENLTAGAVKLRQLNTAELTALLKAVPDICRLKPAPSPYAPASIRINWGGIYGHLCACFGWTYDYIDDHMTLSRLEEMRGYLQDNPPTHQLVAAYMGVNTHKQDAKVALLRAMAARAKAQATQGKA